MRNSTGNGGPDEEWAEITEMPKPYTASAVEFRACAVCMLVILET